MQGSIYGQLTPSRRRDCAKLRAVAWRRALIIAVMLSGALYLGDYLAVKYRIPNYREPFGVVEVRPYYAVRLKNGKTEFMPAEPRNEECVHSLFPHFGRPPCWYLVRHKDRQIRVMRRRLEPAIAKFRP